jgi:lysine decarboxylase
VFLTEPSYVGVMSDVAAIAAGCHAAGVPLLVDGAWGAHLGFHPALPPHAMASGADALVLSTHKTLPAFTQSALLLARGGSLDLRRLAEAFDLLNTTSPSGAIYASIDRARALLEHHGVELLDRTLAQAARVRAALAPGEVVTADVIEALRDERSAGSRIAYCSDPSLDTLLVVVR